MVAGRVRLHRVADELALCQYLSNNKEPKQFEGYSGSSLELTHSPCCDVFNMWVQTVLIRYACLWHALGARTGPMCCSAAFGGTRALKWAIFRCEETMLDLELCRETDGARNFQDRSRRKEATSAEKVAMHMQKTLCPYFPMWLSIDECTTEKNKTSQTALTIQWVGHIHLSLLSRHCQSLSRCARIRSLYSKNKNGFDATEAADPSIDHCMTQDMDAAATAFRSHAYQALHMTKCSSPTGRMHAVRTEAYGSYIWQLGSRRKMRMWSWCLLRYGGAA